jgi:hypothetical protein
MAIRTLFFQRCVRRRVHAEAAQTSRAIPCFVTASLLSVLSIGIATSHQPSARAEEVPQTQVPAASTSEPPKYTLEELEQRPIVLADVPPELLSSTSIQVSDLTNAGLLSPKLVALFPPELTKAVYTTWRALAVVINTAVAIFVVVTTPVGDSTQGPVIQAEPTPPVVEVPKPPSKPPEQQQPPQPGDGAGGAPPESSTTTTSPPNDGGTPVTVPNPNPDPNNPDPNANPGAALVATDISSVAQTESQNPELRVTWRPVPAESWNIYRSTGGPAEFLVNFPGPQTEYIDTAVEAGKGYAYNVAAVIQGREAPWAPNVNNAAQTRGGPLTPTTITSVTPTNADGAELAVSWSALPNVEAWNIYRSTGAPAMFLTRVPGGQLSFVDTGLEFGKSYAYAVSAVVAGQESPWSPGVSATAPTFTPYQNHWGFAAQTTKFYLQALRSRAAWDNGEPAEFLNLTALYNVRVALDSVLTRVEEDPEAPTSPCTMIQNAITTQTNRGPILSSTQRCSPDITPRDTEALANAQRWVKAILDRGMRQYGQGLLDLKAAELQDQAHRQTIVLTTYAQLAEVPAGYGSPQSVVEAKVIHDYQITHAPPPSGGFNFFFFLIPLAIIFAPLALVELFGAGATAAAGGAALSLSGCIAGIAVVGVPTCPI